MLLTPWSLVALFLLLAAPPDDDLDALWAEAARTVAEGDYAAYAALYHADAVLVNAISGAAYPIAVALDGWKQGFDDTAAGRMTASVEFRFTDRIHGEAVAHETGLFRYAWQPEGEPPSTVYVHFDAVLVKQDGAWRWLVEHQKAVATEAEWDAAAPLSD